MQGEVRALVGRFEARAVELRDQLAAASREQREAFDRLAARGESVVGRVRESEAGQQATRTADNAADAADAAADTLGATADAPKEVADPTRVVGSSGQS